jgi:branched-chain amino acid transport system substrate-binding protein
MSVLTRVRKIVLSRNAGFLLLAILIGVAAYVFVFREQYYASAALKRSAGENAWLNRGFTIAIVWPARRPGEFSLREGVQLALDHINRRGGALAGKITLRFYDEIEDKGALARSIAEQEDVVAVIGHELDGTAIPASITYHTHGILFIAPKSTDVRLTGHQFPYVFRLTPDDRDMTAALETFALQNGWKRVGILYARSEHGEAASGRFLTSAGLAGIAVPFMRSYFNTPLEPNFRLHDFRQMLAEIRDQQFDAFALAGELPWAAKLIKDMAQMNVKQPVLATDKLDSSRVLEYSDHAANDRLYVASAVDPDSVEPAYVAFREAFRQSRDTKPSAGYGTAQGYEALMLLANAIEHSGSADPVVVATTLKTNCWKGLFGEVSFDDKGDVIGRHISVKQLRNNIFYTAKTIKDADHEKREEEMKATLAREARTCLP